MKATVVFHRQIDYYVRFSFIPTIFLVFISYCSFFIDHSVASARTMLGVIPILTSFANLGNTILSIPRFSYSCWIVEFLFISTIFNVFAMIEFAFISFAGKRKAHIDRKILKRQ